VVMLRVAPGHAAAASPAVLRSGHPLLVPPTTPTRVARAAAVVPAPAPRTIAVRGHAPNGSAAALILEPAGVCIVTADRSRRRRVRRFSLAEVLVVEEHRLGRRSELVIVTAGGAITVVDVDVAQAWTFCRELRHLILGSAGRRAEGRRSKG
jgi:hypothetical protein